MNETIIRPAAVRDIRGIHRLLNHYAREGLLLPRSLNELYESVRDFVVAAADDAVVGCCALHVSWEDLAEVKCLAVAESHRGSGLGRRLVEQCLTQAAALGIDTVFCLTYQVEFFARLGFVVVDSKRLPHKVWGECVHCPRFPDCDETAMAFWTTGEPRADGMLGGPELSPGNSLPVPGNDHGT